MKTEAVDNLWKTNILSTAKYTTVYTLEIKKTLLFLLFLA